MNKLVSRNPVLRFKEGRKIQKMEWAGVIKTNPTTPGTRIGNYTRKASKFKGPLQWFDENGNPVTKRVLLQFDGYNYSLNPDGTYSRGKIPTTLNKTNLYAGSSVRDYSLLSDKKTIEKSSVEVKQKQNVKTPFKTKTPKSKIYARGTLGNAINDTQKLLLKSTGRFKDADFETVEKFQNALNNYISTPDADAFSNDFFLNTDNIWGDKTQRTFEHALAKALAPIIGEYEYNEDTDTYKMKPIFLSGLPSFYSQSIEEPTLKDVSIPKEPILSNIPLNMDKSQTRDWMRGNNLNPYKYSGALRAGVRRIAGGYGTDDDRNLILQNPEVYDALRKAGYLKQGGNIMNSLPSINIVERFKKGRKVKVNKGVNDFGNKVVETTVTNDNYNPLKTPEIITLEVTYNKYPELNDTTYTYTPSHYFFTNPLQLYSNNWRTVGMSVRRPLFERLRELFNRNFRLVAQ